MFLNNNCWDTILLFPIIWPSKFVNHNHLKIQPTHFKDPQNLITAQKLKKWNEHQKVNNLYEHRKQQLKILTNHRKSIVANLLMMHRSIRGKLQNSRQCQKSSPWVFFFRIFGFQCQRRQRRRGERGSNPSFFSHHKVSLHGSAVVKIDKRLSYFCICWHR